MGGSYSGISSQIGRNGGSYGGTISVVLVVPYQWSVSLPQTLELVIFVQYGMVLWRSSESLQLSITKMRHQKESKRQKESRRHIF